LHTRHPWLAIVPHLRFPFMCPSFLERYCGNGYWRRQVDQKKWSARPRCCLDFYSASNTTCFDPQSLSVGTHNQRELFRGVNHKSTALSVDYTAPVTGKVIQGQRISWHEYVKIFTRFQKTYCLSISLLQAPLDKRDVVKAALSFGDPLFYLIHWAVPISGSSSLPLLLVGICIIPPMATADASVSCWEAILWNGHVKPGRCATTRPAVPTRMATNSFYGDHVARWQVGFESRYLVNRASEGNDEW
jgi:hypothetical protein